MSVYGMFLESYEMFSLHLFSRNRIIRKEILKKHLPNKNPKKKKHMLISKQKTKKTHLFCVCILFFGGWKLATVSGLGKNVPRKTNAVFGPFRETRVAPAPVANRCNPRGSVRVWHRGAIHESWDPGIFFHEDPRDKQK